MAHVFISYAHVDSDFVALLKLELEKAAFEVWVDSNRLRAGEDWRQGIDEAIKSAFALVAVMSPEAFESKYVTYEWAFALGMGVKVIPVMLRTTELHPRLEALQYLDFTSRTDRPWDSLAQHLREIETQFAPSMVHVSRDAPPAVKQAVAALDSHEPDARKVAVESLAQMSHPSAKEALAGAVQHPTRDVRVDAAFRLAELTRYQDARAVPGLVDALSDRDTRVCARAAEALGRIGDESAVPALLDGLRREDGRVRRTAASALSRLGRVSVPGLVDALDHRDQRVRQVATWALGEIKDASALPGLMTALRDADLTVQKEASEALVKIGAPAVPGLIEALKDEDWTVQVSAAKLLGDMMDNSAVAGLVEMLSDEYSDVRKSAADALGKIGDAAAVPRLLEALYDQDSLDVRCAAADALGLIGDTSVVPELTRILQSDMQQTDGKSTEGFGPGLNEMGSWNFRHFCKVVAEVLEYIGTPEALDAVEQWRRGQA